MDFKDKPGFPIGRLFGADEPLLEPIEKSRAYAFGRPYIDYFVAVVRNQFDEITFANASAVGCAMRIEQAIDCALQLSMNL